MRILDHILFKTAEHMSEVKDESAQLVIVTPPYMSHHSQKGKEKEKEFLICLLNECARIVSPTGVVACINTDLRDKGLFYLKHIVVAEAAMQAGLKPKDEKIWIRGFRRDGYRKKFSFVLVFSKQKKIFQKHSYQYEVDNWIFTKSQVIQGFRDAIAPEIPFLLIQNFTQQNDLVVSACAGTGTVVIIALLAGRQAIGYEINPNMKELIIAREKTIDQYFSPQGKITL